MPTAIYTIQKELRQLFNELSREICACPIPGQPIFSTIYLDHPTRAAEHCRKLYRLALHSREFALSIKTINITEHITTDDGRSCSWLAAGNSLPQLLALLESVDALSISCSGGYLRWGTLPVKVSRSFSSLFRRIASLELKCVEGIPITPFMSFSQLGNLILNDVTPEKRHPLDLKFVDLSHDIQMKGMLSSLCVINSFSAMKQLFHCLSHPNSSLCLSFAQFLEVGFCKYDDMAEANLALSAISESVEHLDVRNVSPKVPDSKEFPFQSLDLRQFPNLLSLSYSVDCLYLANLPGDNYNPFPPLLDQLRQIANDSKIRHLYLNLDLTGITADTDSLTSEAEMGGIDAALSRLCRDKVWEPLGQTFASFFALQEVTISIGLRDDGYTEMYEKFCRGLSDSLSELSVSGIRVMFVTA